MSPDIKKVKEHFLNDIKNHTMEVVKEDDLYRHLKFTNNGSSVYRFDIHTWPGYLCITGDMGSYVFSRLPDMFSFFRGTSDELNINPGYWGEKLVASDCNGTYANGVKEFSQKVFEENVTELYEQLVEMHADDDLDDVTEAYAEEKQSRVQQLEELWQAIEEEVLAYSHDGPERAFDAAMNFRWKSDDEELSFDMQDFWEYSCTEFTFHYIWILYAIAWGIQQYDKVDALNLHYEKA
jgi:hypothetical protein